MTLYELLAHRLPFFARDREALRGQILRGHPESLRKQGVHVSWELETVCLAAMAPEPARRYATAAEFARDLHNVLEARTIFARRPSLWLRGRRWVQRHPTLTVFLLLCWISPSVVAWQRDRALQRIQEAEDQRAQFSDDRSGLFHMLWVRELLARENTLWPGPGEADLDRLSRVLDEWLRDAERAIHYVGGLQLGNVARGLSAARSQGTKLAMDDESVDPWVIRSSRRLEQLRAERDALLEQGAARDELVLARTNVRIADLERELGERWLWSFSDADDEWWHQQLVELRPLVEQLVESFIRIEGRRDACRAYQNWFAAEGADRWQDAKEQIAASPRYSGLRIAVQPGLVPLGFSSAGYYEFADLWTLNATWFRAGPKDAGSAGERIFVLVPTCSLRRTAAGRWIEVEPEQAEVQLDPFLIAKHETSRWQWSRIAALPPGQQPDQRPLVDVSWSEAERRMFDLGESLPTWLQWWVAAGGALDTALAIAPPNANFAGHECAGRAAELHLFDPEWTDGFIREAEIGALAESVRGLVATFGNVAEWCVDRPHEFARPRVGDGRFKSDGAAYAAVGGSYQTLPAAALDATLLPPTARRDDLGLRSVRVVRAE